MLRMENMKFLKARNAVFFAFWWTVTIVLQILSLQEDSRRRVCLKEQSTMLSF